MLATASQSLILLKSQSAWAQIRFFSPNTSMIFHLNNLPCGISGYTDGVASSKT